MSELTFEDAARILMARAAKLYKDRGGHTETEICGNEMITKVWDMSQLLSLETDFAENWDQPVPNRTKKDFFDATAAQPDLSALESLWVQIHQEVPDANLNRVKARLDIQAYNARRLNVLRRGGNPDA